ncbi:MAG TPA: alpha/beta fold hydrolase, partial [Arthrobacter sp.]|nr:alpha/beta fold hydrolase [Arthrobacter sp.]
MAVFVRSPRSGNISAGNGNGGTGTLPRARWLLLGAVAGATAGSVLAGATSGLASYFARQVLTPVREHVQDLEILAVVGTGPEQEIILPATLDTTAPGVYSVYFDGGRGVARVGEVTSYSPREGTVQRTVEQVYTGDLAAATRGWWGGAAYPDPAAVGLANEEVQIEVDGGTAPAWLVRAESEASTWAIMVHGRGASRAEGVRAVRAIRELGLTSLLISYRNDGEAPSAPDRRYGLGMTEWRDVEAAIRFALANGAQDVVLVGWSMGGAISLQAADQSLYRSRIRALVLDAPVIDWTDVLAHQARLNRIPDAVGQFSQWLISNKAGRLLTGLAAPLDLKMMNWVARADELRVPTLIVHSEN